MDSATIVRVTPSSTGAEDDWGYADVALVYGSLRKGLGLSRELESSTFLGTMRVQGLTLTTQGDFTGYPYAIMTPDSTNETVVELYRLPDQQKLQSLDWIEGHPSHYTRHLVTIKAEDGECVSGWVYAIPEQEVGALDNYVEVPGGDWIAFKETA